MPTVITQGAASAKGYGFGARSVAANYIEDVFSTYLYTGNGSSQTITNGIDLSTKGGMVWLKNRTADGTYSAANYIVDSARSSFRSYLISNTTAKADPEASGSGVTSVSTSGFVLGTSNVSTNTSGVLYTSWTFRKQAKFFDVVTYTGNGANRTIAHNLGSVPGCIIVKRTDTSADWQVYHRSLASTQYMVLNTTAAVATGTTRWNSTTPTSTVFSLGTDTTVNANGGTYVAYLFAHNAGGFGAAGTDNVISCGSFTTPASGFGEVNLGYEPQFVLVKQTNALGGWYLVDSMRGFIAESSSNSSNFLSPANSNAEGSVNIFLTSTGFKANYAASASLIYIAIRRGPMKTPTSGTSVYNAITRTGTGSAATVTGIGFPPDMVMSDLRSGPNGYTFNRLAGFTNTDVRYLVTPFDFSEAGASSTTSGFLLDGTTTGTISITTGSSNQNVSGSAYIEYFMRRAPGFFDVVCYTGTGANRTVSHNLGVAPEMMIVKSRSNITDWAVYHSALGATKWVELNSAAAESTASTVWNNTAPTASVFSVGTNVRTNTSAYTYVAYLFATVAGVSKVGSYTGSGTTKQIDCGFTSGARFVLIKRTDSTGDWYVWDSARGIVAGNDSYLLLNSTAAEVTNTDYIDTYSAGFEISSTAPAAINANGGSFIFLAVA